jgi:16S rRNA processing protein RimM
MSVNEFYFLGKITRKFSFKGDLIIFLDTDAPSEYYHLDKIFIKIKDRYIPYFIEEIFPYKNNSIRVHFEDINDENEAKMLINKEIYLPCNSLPVLEGNKFYYHEIEGFKIKDKKVGELGYIKYVNDKSPQHLFVVDYNKKEILIPINDDLIENIDRKKKLINMNLPSGLIELYF